MPKSKIDSTTKAIRTVSGRDSEIFLVPAGKGKAGTNILAVALYHHDLGGKSLFFDLALTAILEGAKE